MNPRSRFLTDQLNRRLTRIPPRFTPEIPLHPQIATWVRDYLTDPTTAQPLTLVGPTGVGKTHQAYQVIRTIARARLKQELPTRWAAISHPELNVTQRSESDGTPPKPIDMYLNVDLLFLDDIGAGKQTDWTGDTLYRLVDHRWSHQLVTIHATNLPPKQLRAIVGERVASRISDARKVAFKGDDLRVKGGQAA